MIFEKRREWKQREKIMCLRETDKKQTENKEKIEKEKIWKEKRKKKRKRKKLSHQKGEWKFWKSLPKNFFG